MVNMQMADENVIQVRNRHLQGDGVSNTAIAQIEEEATRLCSTVPQLDQHARAGLFLRYWERRAAHERDPHLVLGEDFRTREVRVAVLDGRPGLVVVRQADATAGAGSRPSRTSESLAWRESAAFIWQPMVQT